MNFSQENKPSKLNLDKSPKSLTPDEAFYLLNHERNVKLNKSIPFAKNYAACAMDKPTGENYSVGTYKSPLTKETYSWVYNSNGIHYIQRIGVNGCEVVYTGCLKLSADPKHSIENFMAYLRVEKLCANRHGKTLIWTNGLHDIGCLDVEASIATNNFSTPFFDRCANGCPEIELCVPEICGCLHGEYIPLPTSEISLTNYIVDAGYKFMVQHEYYDGRANTYSGTSSLFYQDSKECFDTSQGYSRCIRLRVPVGNPMVERINIAYTKDGVNWFIYDTVEKYKKYNSTQQFWYERELAELTNYSDTDCSFDYIFCGEKQPLPLDPKEVTRVRNPIPREAQGFLVIKEAIAPYNYKDGTCPLDKIETDKVKITEECGTIECHPELAEITVRAIIHNTDHDRNQFIYRINGGIDNAPDDTSDRAYFGGLNPSLDGGWEGGISDYNQFFEGTTRNFIVYIEGTSYSAVMEQWQSDAFFQGHGEQKWGTLANLDSGSARNRWRRFARHGGFWYQEAKIKVPKGTKGYLRLSSHTATFQESSTSTYVIGILDSLYGYKGDALGSYNSNNEEIWFDTCAGDIELNSAFVIQDNSVDIGNEDAAAGYHGYVKDVNGKPISGAVVENEGVSAYKSVTDFNGFYHFYKETNSTDDFNLIVKVERDCGNFDTIKTVGVQAAKRVNQQINITVDDEAYGKSNYAKINVPVVDCDGKGVAGVRVALSRNKYRITNSLGVAEFSVRNVESRDQQLTAVIMDTSNCFSIGCDNRCNPCLPSANINASGCYAMGENVFPIITSSNLVINRKSAGANSNGLKAGGSYPFGIIAKGNCGRVSSVYSLGNLRIKKTQEKGGFGFCSLGYVATGLKLPDWVTCVEIVRGRNTTDFVIQAVVDKIERTSDGKMKLTIQSLNDYNSDHGFKTNTVYKYLQNDRVEFIRNGDGKIFSSATYGNLNYLAISPFYDKDITDEESTDVDYFNQLLIEDDSKLSDLVIGATIEIQRPQKISDTPEYFEICASLSTVEVNDGGVFYKKLLNEVGTFHSFDTYLVSRKMGDFPSQIFEHHSPSDFWGDHLSDAGKVHFINKYENEKRFGRNISIGSPTQFNYFGDLVKTVESPEHGDIIAMNITDGKIILIISENDNSIAQSADDLLRVGSDGVIRALPADLIIGSPEVKLSGKYGCKYEHVGSVFFGDGWATWVDENKYIVHDYRLAKVAGETVARDGSIESVANSYFRIRGQEINSYNKTATNDLNKFRYITGLNESTGAVIITIKSLRHSGVNNEKQPYLKPNETILYHPRTDEFLTFASHTAEAYSNIDLQDDFGCAFVSYLNGIPYIHPILADENKNDWDEFYGVSVDRVIGIALNKHPTKIKVPLSIEIQDNVMWFVTNVTTDSNSRFSSEIPPAKFKKVNNKWNASFLFNKNSTGGLQGNNKDHVGEQAKGYCICLTFVRNNTVGLIYNSIDNSKRTSFDELDMILFKFGMIEQSGFSENL